MLLKQQLLELLDPEVAALGCILWGIDLKQQSRSEMRLIVYIDKQQGVTLEDCSLISEQISGVLEVVDLIAGAYTLEVSSPGLDRPLFTEKQYSEYIGAIVKISCLRAVQRRRNFKGKLLAVESSNAIVEVDGNQYTLAIDNVKMANLVPSFNN